MDGCRASSPSGPQSSEKETHCPRCGVEFTTTFRRHHCRQCGQLRCDDCSRHRINVSGHEGKVRVCEDCIAINNKHHAAGHAEDLEALQQTVEILRSNLRARSQETEVFERVLLEFEAQATEDRSQLDQYANDKDSKGSSFPKIHQRVRDLWKELQASGEEHAKQRIEVQKQQDVVKEESQAIEDETVKLERLRQELDAELREITKIEAECDEKKRREIELDKAVQDVRDSIDRLKQERQRHLDREAERLRRRLPGGSVDRGSPPPSNPMSITISSGRQDPLSSGASHNRLEGCQRKCSLM